MTKIDRSILESNIVNGNGMTCIVEDLLGRLPPGEAATFRGRILEAAIRKALPRRVQEHHDASEPKGSFSAYAEVFGKPTQAKSAFR